MVGWLLFSHATPSTIQMLVFLLTVLRVEEAGQCITEVSGTGHRIECITELFGNGCSQYCTLWGGFACFASKFLKKYLKTKYRQWLKDTPSTADQKQGLWTEWKLKLKNGCDHILICDVKQGRKLKYHVLAGKDDCLPKEGVYYVWFCTVGGIM